MKKILIAAAIAAGMLRGAAFGAQFSDLGVSAAEITSLALAEAGPVPQAAPAEKAARGYYEIFMTVRRGTGTALIAEEVYGPLEITVVPAAVGWAVEAGGWRWTARRTSAGLRLAGDGLVLEASQIAALRFGVEGFVAGENGAKEISVEVEQDPVAGQFRIRTGRTYLLFADQWGISVRYSEKNSSRKAAAALMAMVLALRCEAAL